MTKFFKRRDEGLVTQVAWFRRRSRQLFCDLYPACLEVFVFSNGWFAGLRRRRGISWRAVTKVSQKLPAEFVKHANNFVRFIRKVSHAHPERRSRSLDYILSSPSRRFKVRCIMNTDETPLPFEFNAGRTYDATGVRTVRTKSSRSGWEKRQATLILYIFADGVQRLKPKLIFHGTPTEEGGELWKKEGHLYAEGLTIEYNRIAYNNEDLFKSWIRKELQPLTDGEEYLLVMDVATFHTTKDMLNDLRNARVTVALIPNGCTGILQPLDVSVNKPFKSWVQEETEYLEEEEDLLYSKKWSLSERRILLTKAVIRAYARLELRPEMVSKSFIKCGISVRPDGSQDHFINIKDILPEEINFAGWEPQEQSQNNPLAAIDKVLDDHEVDVVGGCEFETQLRLCKVPDLKARLKAQGLPTIGLKDTLIQRLVKHVYRPE